MVKKYAIGLARYGCANRPFYRIAAMCGRVIPKQPWDQRVIEQIGSFDPLPNKHNEKMVAINYERLRYWLSQNAICSHAVAELLGLCGFLPVYPKTAMRSMRNRAAAAKKQAELGEQKSDQQTDADKELNMPQS